MSNYIVLVKQVPDVKQITDNAFNPETGTLIRSRLASVINELDTLALAFAYHMKQISSDTEARIIALTMGPPMADEVLRYSLSRCADTAVLLTDRALGGADTVATANPLAYAIRKIVKDILNNDQDYYVLCGMQSVDGDTAQVPPQIAEELGIPCIAYATDAEFRDGQFEFTRIISGGSQIVTPKNLPAVVTVVKYEYPLFSTFAATRRANKMDLFQWNAEDVNAPMIGIKGSKTWVIRVFPPPKSTRKCRHISTPVELAEIIRQEYAAGNASKESRIDVARRYVLPGKRKNIFDRSFEGTQKEIDDFAILEEKVRELGITGPDQINEQSKQKILDAAGENFHIKALEDMLQGIRFSEPSYKGQVWVVAEHTSDKIHPATFELIGKARDLAESLETKVGVVISGDRIEHHSQELIAAGADYIYVIEHQLLKQFDPAAHRKAIAEAVSKYSPQIVLFAATPRGRMLAPMVAYRTGSGLTADCTSLGIYDSTRKSQIAVLLQTRPALGGNVMATICTKNSKSQMATARPGVMKKLTPDPSRVGKVIKHNVTLTEDDISLEIIKTELGTGEVHFDSDIIVSGGRGLMSKENYQQLITSFSDSLRSKFNASIEKGASRAAVEQGYTDRIHQVGQTGTAVSPNMYFAMGISGAIQHMIGIANSKTIIAVNKDPDAPIFKQCDYYIVGSVEEIIPKLIKAFEGNSK
ncbi:MAG: electron transfer flavoprotein subunit beta [Candidatus Brocadiia bacterium]|nr:MAG: electron transfer flavoprotein subunit beta [Candidatus Brocadiia bacterium]